MESYKVLAYYDFGGRKRICRKFATLQECDEWISDNRSVSIKVGSSWKAVPYESYEVYRVSESMVKTVTNG